MTAEMKLFDVPIDFSDYDQLLETLFRHDIKTITCLNQHYLNLCCEDASFKHDVQEFDLIHPDGIGVQMAAFFLANFRRRPPRIVGSELYFKILVRLSREKRAVYLLGDTEDVLNKVVQNIGQDYIGVRIRGRQNGFDRWDSASIIKEINESSPYMILVGLGAPRQERWIIGHRHELLAPKIIAVGGGFRVIGGDRKRGPAWIQKMGLEWLVRLLEEPGKYWRRYLVGIPLFIYRVMKHKFLERSAAGPAPAGAGEPERGRTC